MNGMRLIFIIIMIVVLSSCSTKYKGSHKDFKKFSKDIQYCLKKSCINKTKNVLYNISFISTALAYGGGGGGGGMVEAVAAVAFRSIKFLIKFLTCV